MKKVAVIIIAILISVLFVIPAMAGNLSKTARYESYGVFDIWVLEVRDTRGTLGYQSYDKWRYKSTDGHRYKISVDYDRSTFYNCWPDDYMRQDKVTARQQGDWSWTAIKIVAKDRLRPWDYTLRVNYKRVR